MVLSTNLGFPRMGANRDLKKTIENFWAGKIDQKALLCGAQNLRLAHWKLQLDNGITNGYIPSNDFTLYDHVLDHSVLFGVIPDRYQSIEDPMDQYFAMARGMQNPSKNVDVASMEMKKWFDTNYHYIVPEFKSNQQFKLNPQKIINEFNEAKSAGILTRPVIIGPISFLLLGKPQKGHPHFDLLSLLDHLIPAYMQLLQTLKHSGVETVQIDEPFLVLDLNEKTQQAYLDVYTRLTSNDIPKIMLTTYFDEIGSNLSTVLKLPIHALHIDLIRGNVQQLDFILQNIPSTMILSLGIVNGRNIWKTNLRQAMTIVEKVVDHLGSDRVLVAPSCSLLHVPHSLSKEVLMNPEVLDWLAFANEKLIEISVISKAIKDGEASVKEQLEKNSQSIQNRKTSKLVHDESVRKLMGNLTKDMFTRKAPFNQRILEQQAKLGLCSFPTTTVGSFPQTKDVRVARQKWKKGELNQDQYDAFIRDEIKKCVEFQERIGLDVLVHGEFERNDMVEYFGEQLHGYAFSENGWVQSYGSRCVKPPIIYGDVSRPKPMTVDISVYAQSLTKKPMKGMLTGPVTMLQWSFVRDDQPRRDTAFQLALALRQEVQNLEKAAIPVIQIDEPALREGLPLRKQNWSEYLTWAVDAFLLSSTGVMNSTQIHTHMCYSDFNDIFTSIQALDTDCITIEASKSDLKLLSAFEQYGFTQGIGPGIYDIHSPRVPSVMEMKERLQSMLKYIPENVCWVNPDCGLKTRGWVEVEAALKNLVEVAKLMRNKK